MRSDRGRSAPRGADLAAAGGLRCCSCICRCCSSSSMPSPPRRRAISSRRRADTAMVRRRLAAPGHLAALWLSVKVALISTLIALVLGTCAAAAVSRFALLRPRGRSRCSFILPIALPGIITGIALRSAFNILPIFPSPSGPSCSATRPSASSSSTTMRRALPPHVGQSLIEASMDLGADGFQTFRHVVLPNIAPRCWRAACSPSRCPSTR
jgi:putative spermidine/putrescine transport system permease protein